VVRTVFIALLAAAAVAVFPGVTLAQDVTAAQDAGGKQYTDPLDDGPTGSPTDMPTAGTPTPTSTPGTTTTASTEAGSADSAGTADGKSKPGVPRTGFPVVWLWLAGSFSIGAGLALRAAARPSA
jgi:hypothetical protein